MKKLSLDNKVTSFTEFTDEFYSRFPDLSVFDRGKTNYLKVVLDGLKVNYLSKGRFEPYWITGKGKFKRALKQFRKQPVPELKENRLLIVDTGRTIMDGERRVSQYFGRILQFQSQLERPPFVVQRSNEKLETSDVLYDDFRLWIGRKPDHHERTVLSELKSLLASLENTLHAEDLFNVSCAFHVFFGQYLVWRRIIDKVKPENLWFICHYHNEALIMAARDYGVLIHELQHGLISPTDIFYCMPESVEQVRDRALFPDDIWTFGDYWSKLLRENGSEFSDSSVKEGGYYLFEPDAAPDEELRSIRQENKTIWLITSQTKLSANYVEYILNVHDQVTERGGLLLLKPHPNENIANYDSVRHLKSLRIITNKSLGQLFGIADAHITIYSTTVFDALRYGFLRNYCINIPAQKDYIDHFLQLGVAKLIEITELPDPRDTSSAENAEHFYCDVKLPLALSGN